MTNTTTVLFIFFMALILVFIFSGCSKSVDGLNQILDVSRITATGSQGPADFTGTIDFTDWDSSSYRSILRGKSFWIQNSYGGDTISLGGRLAGDTATASLRIYNAAGTNLTVTGRTQNPFFTSEDSIVIQPLTIDTINLSFILPDTFYTVHTGTLTLRFSTNDSMNLILLGRRDSFVTANVGPGLPTAYTFAPAYPNPSNGLMAFTFALPQQTSASITVVNQMNDPVATIAQGNYVAGVHLQYWQANLPNGNYRVFFKAGTYSSHGDIKIVH